MNCKNFCLLCDRPKVYTINYSKYHGVCEHEKNLNRHLTCIHCNSVAPVLYYSLANPDCDINLLPQKREFEPFTGFGEFNKPTFGTYKPDPKQTPICSSNIQNNLRPQPHPIKNDFFIEQIERDARMPDYPVQAFESNLRNISFEKPDSKLSPLLSSLPQTQVKNNKRLLFAVLLFVIFFLLAIISLSFILI